MESTKKNNQFILYILLFSFCIYFLSRDYGLLGFFADDGTTLYYLTKDLSVKEVLHHSFSWDAGRDLHLIWQKFFIAISGFKLIENLHLFQIIFYLINSFLFAYILLKLNFKKEIILIIWVVSIFFPSYSEVVLWIHAFTMVLISTLFFLIFIILNIQSIKHLTFKENLYVNLFITLLFLLSLFTYEQCIFVALVVVFITNFTKYKKNFLSKENFILITLYYFLISFTFSIYKLYDAGFFNDDIIKYQTGSNIVLGVQFFKNLIIGFGTNISEFIKFNSIRYFFQKNLLELIIFNFLFFICLNSFFFNKKNKIIKKNKVFKKVLICLVCFVASLTPLYFHYISDRHFYLPSFFMFIGIGYVIQYLLFSKKFFLLKNLILILIFLYSNQFIGEFNKTKKNYVENFKLKNDFYNQLENSKKINFNKDKIYLINFPDLYNGEKFFAHEPEVNFKLIKNNEDLPLILRNSDDIGSNNLVYFLKVKNNKIIYEIK